MKIHVAIAIGLFAGLAVGLLAASTESLALMRFTEGVSPIGTAFLNLIRMIVIPLVTTTLFAGVAGLGNLRRLGRLGGLTLAFFWSTALLGILMGMTVMKLAEPLAPASVGATPSVALAEETAQTARSLPDIVDFLLGLITSNPIRAAADGNLLQLIVFVALFGAAAATLPSEQRQHLIGLADTVTRVLIKIVHWILITAPVGVFALAAPITARSGWAMLQSLGVFVIAVAFGLAVFTGLVYIPAVKLLGRISPQKFLRACVAPGAVAASTTSSVATLPVALEAVERDLGISRPIAALVISLGSSLNRGGSALFQGAAVVFLAGLYDVPLPATALAGAVLATFLVSLTVASVPSASVVTLAPALGAVGVPLDGLAVLLGVDRIPDMCRTATNVIGHMATSSVIERFGQREKRGNVGTAEGRNNEQVEIV